MQGYPAGKRAFRAWVRAHHPDLGGDPEAFAEGLRQWRARMTGLPPVPGPPAAATVLPAPAGSRRLGGALAATAQAAPVAAAALKWLGVAGAAE